MRVRSGSANPPPAPLAGLAACALAGNLAAGCLCAALERRSMGVLLDIGVSPWVVAVLVVSCAAAVASAFGRRFFRRAADEADYRAHGAVGRPWSAPGWGLRWSRGWGRGRGFGSRGDWGRRLGWAAVVFVFFLARAHAWRTVRPGGGDVAKLAAAQVRGQRLGLVGRVATVPFVAAASGSPAPASDGGVGGRAASGPAEFRMTVTGDLLHGKTVVVKCWRLEGIAGPTEGTPGLEVGDVVRVSGRVEGPWLARNPGEFSGSEYLLRQRAAATVYATVVAPLGGPPGAGGPARENRRSLPSMVRERLRQGVKAALLGSPPRDVEAVLALLSRSTDHGSEADAILARSGLAGFVCSKSARCLVWGLLFMGLTRLAGGRGGALVAAAAAGALLAACESGFGPGVVRGVVGAVAGAAALVLGRPRSGVNWLALALVVLLATDPLSPASPSFWLGFSAAAAICLGWHGTHALAIPARAAAATLPIAAYYFGLVDIGSPVLGALLYPVASCLHVAAAVLAVMGPSAGLLVGLGGGLRALCNLLVRLASWKDAARLGSWEVARPDPLLVAAYEASLMVWLARRQAVARARRAPETAGQDPVVGAAGDGAGAPTLRGWNRSPGVVQSVAVTGALVILSVSLPFGAASRIGLRRLPCPPLHARVAAADSGSRTETAAPTRVAAPGPAGLVRMTFLSVGEGDATVVHTPDGACVVVDAGRGSHLGNYLVSQGFRRLDLVVVTHWHADHAGGLDRVVGLSRVGCLVSGSCAEDESRALRERFMKEVGIDAGHGCRSAGRKRPLDLVDNPPYLGLRTRSGVEITVLGWDRSSGEPLAGSDNLGSLAVVIRYGEVAALLPGDLPVSREPNLVAVLVRLGLLRREDAAAGVAGPGRRSPARIWVLKAAHHGSAGSNGSTLLGAIRPSVCVVPVGPNPWGHPSEAAIRRIEATGAAVVRTDMAGAVSVVTDGSTVAASGYPRSRVPLASSTRVLAPGSRAARVEP